MPFDPSRKLNLPTLEPGWVWLVGAGPGDPGLITALGLQALAQAEGVLARDQATLANAQVVLQRYQTLLAQDSIARQDVDNQAAVVRQTQGTIKTDEAAVGQAKLNLAYTHITAPVAGRVGLRQVDVGNYVTVGQTTSTTSTGATGNGLVVITQTTPIDVLFTLPEDNLPQVTARLRAGATLPIQVISAGLYRAPGDVTLLRMTEELLCAELEVEVQTLKLKKVERFVF